MTRITRRSRVDYLFELRELLRRRDLIKYLTGSMLKAGHRDLLLGELWWLLEPVLHMLIFVWIVTVVFHRSMPHYDVFVFCAILPYRWFTQAVSQSQSTISGLGPMMRDIAFPKAVYPIALTTSNLVNFIFGLGFLFVLMLVHGIPFSFQLVWLVPIIMQMYVFTLGVALLIAALTPIFRDLKNIMVFVFQIIFYMSPSLYGPESVPARFRLLFDLNPFGVIYTSFRNVLMNQKPPELLPFLAVCLFSVVLLAAGFMVFTRLEKVFPKIL